MARGKISDWRRSIWFRFQLEASRWKSCDTTKQSGWQYIYIYIYITLCMLHRLHNQVALTAWISLTLLSIRPYHPSLSAGFPNYILCPHRAAVCKFLLTNSGTSMWRDPLENVTYESFLLLHHCPVFLVRFVSMVFEMGSKWLYKCCFVGCRFQDLFQSSSQHSCVVPI